jgi:hypothetical protein
MYSQHAAYVEGHSLFAGDECNNERNRLLAPFSDAESWRSSFSLRVGILRTNNHVSLILL